MSLSITRVGRHQLRDAQGAVISQHTDIKEAYERASTLPAGTYTLAVADERIVVLGSVSTPPVDPPPPPPPPPVVPEQPATRLGNLLNFAQTWARNWNHGGHAVDARFNGNYGQWDYADNVSEPWLFDRPTVGFRLFALTGDTAWRDKAVSDLAWYAARIDAQGIFTPKGFDDTKYSYVTPFVLYEKLTGDQQYRPVAKRIYDAWLREWPDAFNPNAALWTEREIAFALEAAVAYYELTAEPSALARARALVEQWTVASGSAGAPLVTYTQHEGGGPGGTTPTSLTNSPWMSALYFQAARRLYDLTGDLAPLEQASRYFDWLDVNGFYDAALAHVEYTGLVFPRYLTGELIGDAGYDEGNAGHALDVAGLCRFARLAKVAIGADVTRAAQREAEMLATADRDFQLWTRTTTYLPKYRLSPPRKFNWQVRGYHELVR